MQKEPAIFRPWEGTAGRNAMKKKRLPFHLIDDAAPQAAGAVIQYRALARGNGPLGLIENKMEPVAIPCHRHGLIRLAIAEGE